MNFFLTALCFLAFAFTSNAQLEWFTYRGAPPGNTVIGGSEGTRQLPICRCEFKGHTIPGKVVDRRCNISLAGAEHIVNNFEVLTQKGDVQFSWEKMKKGDRLPEGAFMAGKEGANALYVGRMPHGPKNQQKGNHPGKVVKMQAGHYNCYIGYGGKEYESSEFEVLVVKSDASPVYKVGDEHPCGGIVISVDATGKKGVMAAKKDIQEENISKTIDAVKVLGAGWSVPNPQTVAMLYASMKRDNDLDLNKGWYWTSNQVSQGYWAAQNFADGKQGNRFSGEKLYCRPVKSFDENTKCKAPAKEVAKGKKARQSSTAFDARGSAANAVDGNKDGNWKWANNSITHTNDEKDPWWEVDLGEVYDISKIEIWNRRDCCWDRLQNFHVMVSDKPISANSTTQDQYKRGAHSFTSGDHPSMILEGDKQGRYVRIFVKGEGKPLSLTEVEVYGSAVN